MNFNMPRNKLQYSIVKKCDFCEKKHKPHFLIPYKSKKHKGFGAPNQDNGVKGKIAGLRPAPCNFLKKVGKNFIKIVLRTIFC